MHTYVLLSPYQINSSSVCFTSSVIERTWTFTAIILKASSFEYGRCEALNTISVKLRVRRCPCSEATSTLAAKLRVGSYARSEASSTLSKLLCKSTWRASRPLRVGQKLSRAIWRKCRVDRLRTNISGLSGLSKSMRTVNEWSDRCETEFSCSMVLFLITTDKKRILRQKVDERSFTTQYRVRVVRWHRNHASCRMQVPSKPHICSELQRG